MTGRLRFAPALLQASLIFALSARPAGDYPQVELPGLDKAVHFGLYAPLGAALQWALGGPAAWAAGLGAAYGVSDEVHQAFVPTREPDVFDVVADALGAAAGAFGMAAWRRRRAGRKS